MLVYILFAIALKLSQPNPILIISNLTLDFFLAQKDYNIFFIVQKTPLQTFDYIFMRKIDV